MTYIDTSKPKRISVAAGVVHIIILLSIWFELTSCLVHMVLIMHLYQQITLSLFMNKR